MALVIPGFCRRFDIPDVVRAIAPRRLLLVSASRDPYSLDADEIYDECVDAFVGDGLDQGLQQKRCDGEHNLDQERFDHIVDWMKSST